ncbi:PIG-L family deacetylase [Actinoallomurus spadix]|uniref:PIG-L family deacetylase n=1 Tax=Actinoallomurus spadix TaxID=79912 RepID=A0ABN0WQG1_9ACTN|nr:PIG-L family deacetylase [Actinoallomurus spadix]MCO5991674.1 PIG-L family deacetylase [Actinoallomurus spadix]
MTTTTISAPSAGTTRPRTAVSRPRRPATGLPPARRVLAVVARPGDETWYLGAVLETFRSHGAHIGVLCFTRGEKSPYNDSLCRLETIRPREFDAATAVLHAEYRTLIDYPDDGLNGYPIDELTEHVTRAITEWDADLLLTVDGRGTERTAARAAVHAGRERGIPVLAWTLPHDLARAARHAGGPAMSGDLYSRIDFEVRVDRRIQRQAARAHRSQNGGDRPQQARLALQGDYEWLRRLVPPAPATGTDVASPAAAAAATPAGGARAPEEGRP